jgi:exopolysaccharide production protein ExoZ
MKDASKLNNIQLLRAFAAIAVVIFHTGFRFPGMRPFGSFGVDVFFVISGYIMARILDPINNSSDHFFRRRILRIVPPYWFFTLLIFFAAMKAPQLMGATRATGIDLFKSLFFIPFSKGNGLVQPLLFIGWSLNAEMFFYVALTIGLLLSKRRATWFGAIVVLLVIFGCMPFAAVSDPAHFYSSEVNFEFLLGILSYYAAKHLSLSGRLRLPALLLAFLSALWLIFYQGVMPAGHYFYGLRVLMLGLPAFLLITSAALLSRAGWDSKAASLVLIGDASYILYLIHPYCEYSLNRLFSGHHPWLNSKSATGALIGVMLSIVLALLIHLYGERPLVKLLNRHFGGRRKSAEFAPAK